MARRQIATVSSKHSTSERLPAVVIVNSSPGFDGRGAFYAEALNAAGIATLEIDMLQGAGMPPSPVQNLPHLFASQRYLAAHPRIDGTRADQARIYWGYLTYRLGVLNMRRLAATLSRWLDGREEREVIDHCRLWYGSEVRNYFREFVLEKIEEHRRAGHVVALLTGGTHYLNDLIAADLGLDHVLASRLEVVDGKFTGKPSGTLC